LMPQEDSEFGVDNRDHRSRQPLVKMVPKKSFYFLQRTLKLGVRKWYGHVSPTPNIKAYGRQASDIKSYAPLVIEMQRRVIHEWDWILKRGSIMMDFGKGKHRL